MPHGTTASSPCAGRSDGKEPGGGTAPLVTIAAVHGAQRIAAADGTARALGIHPGTPLADARAMAPDLRAVPDDPAAEAGALERLADWATRYTPWTAVDPAGGLTAGGSAGLWLDISGCAHLFGGETALLDDLTRRLDAGGLDARTAVADTPGAAWAAARFAGAGPVIALAAGETQPAIAPLPVAGLRLEAATAADLARLGLGRIGDLAALPRAPLATRFGVAVAHRLDQALGRVEEPVSPHRPLPDLRLRLSFAEPVGRRDDLAAALDRLLVDLCARLERDHQGARRLEFRLYRADGTTDAVQVGTSRPVRDARHLSRLFADKLDTLDLGFGVDMVALAALALDPLVPAQTALDKPTPGREPAAMTHLIDRLGNRLGHRRVMRLANHASHLPERASRAVAAGAPVRQSTPGPAQPRPVRLLPWPEPIEVVAPVPDHPPVLFRWHRRTHRVARAEGPERIAPEWWRQDGDPLDAGTNRLRDYYRVEDADGRRFWLYREGLYRPDHQPKWYLHGFFG